MELTGSDYPGCPAIPQYLDSKGKVLVSMGGEEYLNFIKAAWKYFNEDRDFRRKKRQALLVHDRGKAHTSKVVKEGLKVLSLPAVTTPPRSPDLMPLDYGIFGTCKLELDRRVPRTGAWEARVRTFKELIKNAGVGPTIGQFGDRLQAVIIAGGGHLERALREVRAE